MATHLPAMQALRAFEAAARLGSLTRAAEALHLTHGAISHQIKALESDLGVRLMERAGMLSGLRFVTENLVAILPEEGRSIDWHMHYMIAPLREAVAVTAQSRVRVRFRYDAGDSIVALLASIAVELTTG